jgi:hypothetical protein
MFRGLILGIIALSAITSIGQPQKDATLQRAEALYPKLICRLTPSVKQWVDTEAAKFPASPDLQSALPRVRKDAEARFAGQLTDIGSDAMSFIVLVRANQLLQTNSTNDSRNSQPKTGANTLAIPSIAVPSTVPVAHSNTLPRLLPSNTLPANASQTGQAKRAAPVDTGGTRNASSNKPDPNDDMSRANLSRLQLAMDGDSKLTQTLSNLLKRISDTETSLLANLK